MGKCGGEERKREWDLVLFHITDNLEGHGYKFLSLNKSEMHRVMRAGTRQLKPQLQHFPTDFPCHREGSLMHCSTYQFNDLGEDRQKQTCPGAYSRFILKMEKP